MRTMISAAAALSFALASVGLAQDQQATEQPAATSMQLPTPNEEVRALAPAFGRSMEWTETVPAGEMGPGSKEMAVKARADCRTIANGFGYSCPIEMVVGEGKEAMKFSGEMLIAYDQATREFRGFTVFNDGNATPMVGKLKGKTLTLETTADVMEMGQRMRGRMTFDFTDPNNVKFTESHKVAGGEWETAAETIMKPAQSRRARSAPPTR